MPRITLRQLLDHAAERGYAVPAFNINNMEQGLAIMQAAATADAPVILQVSRGARSYAGDTMLARMMDALTEMHPGIPVCVHQDHGNDDRASGLLEWPTNPRCERPFRSTRVLCKLT